MKLVKVSQVLSQYMYICPDSNCEWPTWCSTEELNARGFFIVCACGKKYKPDPPEEIKNKQKKEAEGWDKDGLKSQLLDFLLSAGYASSEAKEKINAIYVPGVPIDTLIVKALSV